MEIKGYELLKQEEIKDIHATGYLYRHKRSGARICVLSNEDENKVFHITFRTRRKTVPALLISWSTVCSAAANPFPPRTRLWSWSRGL